MVIGIDKVNNINKGKNTMEDQHNKPQYITQHQYEPPIRSTYTAANAELFKPTFQRLLKEQQDLFISASETGYKTNTLYMKLSDGLRWLCHNDVDATLWRTLRGRLVVKRVKDGVLLKMYAQSRNPAARGPINAVAVSSEEWFPALVAWLKHATPEEVFIKEDVQVSMNNRRQVNELLGLYPGAECQLTDTSVKVMR